MKPYQYTALTGRCAFRTMELLPEDRENGGPDSPLACRLSAVEWDHVPAFEAISYVWGTTDETAIIYCEGAPLVITKSLHTALVHMRLADRPRVLWADAVCIDQSNQPERGGQVGQMQRIYKNATGLLVWLGPDTENLAAKDAVRDVNRVSEYICNKTGIQPECLPDHRDIYQEVIFANKDTLPPPNEAGLEEDEDESDGGDGGDRKGSADDVDNRLWKNLRWFYSHNYFTRVWVIQELNAMQLNRTVYCGHQTIDWHCVEVVAGYIIMDTGFSRKFRFSTAYCWWAAIVSTDRIRRPKNWLSTLYLASNFYSTDLRDAVYGLLGLITVSGDSGLRDISYDKPVALVYVDTVEAALVHFRNTDVILYAAAPAVAEHRRPLIDEKGNVCDDAAWPLPTWAPLWNKPMLFRNPFRFGRALPWQPAGNQQSRPPVWSIDRVGKTLTLLGYLYDTIELAETYNEGWFGNAVIDSDDKRRVAAATWTRVLHLLQKAQSTERQAAACRPDVPQTASLLTKDVLHAAAVSLSYGLDETSTPVAEDDLDDDDDSGALPVLLGNFVAYLELLVDPETLSAFVPASLLGQGDGRAFGKPVWDFTYPASSLFVTKRGLVGCCISTTQPGDVVFAPYGSTYPTVLRPEYGDTRRGAAQYRVRGFSYVNGVMRGERQDDEATTVRVA
ncbi:ankyrin repeat and sam domain containing protein 6 [Ophiostoma piceae UAMH 11346]|uniref:Ankyrin repeat and sam domain containing protein 6 n=1 Tax=Ophiostoma piceae (strain UAMH 11346) TaxID=1262450 RepID=S3C9Z5_OPHP1|nr:ankyrin repeat and sam domain containing protein 6 [Ophiostoma piceae UAMH 11346]